MVGLSANTSLVFNVTEKLAAIPIYGNIRISPAIGGDNRLTFQFGLGKSFALGRGNLSGIYKKFALGIESEDDLFLFVALETHGYRTINLNNQISTFSLGISFIQF